MKILLSPAKSLDENIEFNEKHLTQPEFSEEGERLVKKMQKLSIGQIGKLMHISTDLASLNYDRYQAWPEKLNKSTAFPAGLVFNGAAYLGLSFATLSEDEQLRGQNQLRILSGLYGLLKPFDLIHPYRLEMGTSLKITPKVTNLYKFWGDKIHNKILSEMKESEDTILVNLASSEYAKAALLNKMNGIQVITPVFKDRNKAGIYKMNMHFAKTARGLMTRYILQEDIKEVNELKAFDTNGYSYAENESTANEFVYLRD